jgi:DNA-binding NarL/FixJ family response regulator
MTIGVFLVDDHEVVRRGLCDLLETEVDIEVVGEAGTAEEALAGIAVTHAQVAVLDVRLPDGNGIEVCREIRSRHPEIGCLLLTSFADDEALADATMAGAAGYVLKGIRGSDLVASIRRVATGESLLDPTVTGRALERIRRGAELDPAMAQLTGQEDRVLDLVVEGMTNQQIATLMGLAEKTVKNYMSNILMKLGVRGRTEAAVYAVKVAGRHRNSPSD